MQTTRRWIHKSVCISFFDWSHSDTGFTGTSSPVPTRAASKMPGALYDWSSPEPESQEERHVRFASSVISPPLQRPTPSPEREKGREWPKARHIRENPTRIKHRDLSYIASQASDTSYATPPPSTTDSEDIGISQESSFNPRPPTLHDTYSGPSFTNIRPPLSSGPGSLVPHSRTSSQASQPLTDRDAPRSAPAFPADSFSFSSMSERSVEQDRISALEDEVRKLKEEVSRVHNSLNCLSNAHQAGPLFFCCTSPSPAAPTAADATSWSHTHSFTRQRH